MLRGLAHRIRALLGRSGPAQVVIPLGVSYRSEPDLVRALLEAVAHDCPLVLANPPAIASFDDFGASALSFSLTVSIADSAQTNAVATELRTRILKALRQAGIEMPYAQHDIHLRDLDGVRAIIARLAEERAFERDAQRETEAQNEAEREAPPQPRRSAG